MEQNNNNKPSETKKEHQQTFSTYGEYRHYAADKSKYNMIDPNYKRPQVFELWEKFSMCSFQKLPPSNNMKIDQENKAPCRGLYRRITDIMEDSYFLIHHLSHGNESKK